MPVWDSRGAKIFIQPGGPGNQYYFTDIETDMEAISGGSISFQSDYAGDDYVGSRKTANPGDVTGTVNARRYDTASGLRDIAESMCYAGLLVANGCTTLDIADFNSALFLTDLAFTARQNVSAKLVDRMAGDNPKVLDTLPFRAARAQEWRRLNSSRISGVSTSGTVTPTRIIALGNKSCAGCGGPANDGNQEFIGLATVAAAAPRIFYTADAGTTWKNVSISGIANGSGVNDATRIGDSILVAVNSGAGIGIYRLSYAELKNAATTVSTNSVTVTVATINRILAVGSLVFACGNSGVVYVSKDRGFSFTQLSHGLTVANLVSIAARDENLVVFGGASGAVLVYQSGVFSLKNTGVASQVDAIAIPNRVTDETYCGHADGTIYRSRDSRVTWERVQIPLFRVSPIGTGITYLQFVGDRGALLFIMRGTTDVDILVDRSGGGGGAAIQQVRVPPGSPDLVSMVMTTPNFGLALGEVISNVAVVERISG